jgi:methyl-accepting chemotaxis protein
MSTKSLKQTGNIIVQLRIALVILLSFSVVNLGFIYRQISSMTSDGRIVNYSGIVRGKTQRLIKLVLFQYGLSNSTSPSQEETEGFPNTSEATGNQVTIENSPNLQQDIDTITSELDKVIEGLGNGDKSLRLVAIQDSTFQSDIQQIEQAWSQLKVVLEDFENNPASEERNQLLQASEVYWELTNKAVFSAESFAKQQVESSKRLAIVLFGLNLIVLALIWKISRSIQTRLKSTVSNLTSSSSEISATIAEQERVASQQAASVNETTATMDELEASFRQSSEQASVAVAAARQALELTESGTQTVSENLKGIFALEKKVEVISEQMLQLSEQASQISNISQLVSDIANQTNMLALNSSVEAVRAGEHGKGFTIVAGEIRKLSDQSQRSAEKISTLVSEIQEAINSTVMLTEEGTKTVKAEVKTAQKTMQAFSGVADAINNVVVSNQQISLNLKQQLDGIQQVVQAMEVINQGAKETAAGLTQAKVGTEQLNHAASNLKKMA